MVSWKFLRMSLIVLLFHPAYPQNVILLSERVLLTSQVERDAGQCFHSITVDFILQERGENRCDYLRGMFYYCWWNACCMPLPRFRPAALQWFSSAETRRMLAQWCRRSPCQSQPCSPRCRTSSPSPLKLWRKERRSGKPCIDSGAHKWPLPCIFTPSWLFPICPSPWCPCS